ncbi:hypothetical protein SAMN06296386_11054 [Lachnospiraceae bacterium]|nr:hypothetical protein SAMN06296386_11054 [Lachnospiraceae bacterium]
MTEGNDTEQEVCGKKVYEFAEWIDGNSAEDSVVLVAVSPKYVKEITSELNKYTVDYYCLTDKDYYLIFRHLHPFYSSDFLINKNPVSTLFGFDRGMPIDRWFIEKFLLTQTNTLDKRCVSRILEVGDYYYSKTFFPQEEISKDVLRYDKGMDLTVWNSLPKETYDVFISTQVFNFIFDVKKAIGGAWYTLKKVEFFCKHSFLST